jgi:hypothetical protein
MIISPGGEVVAERSGDEPGLLRVGKDLAETVTGTRATGGGTWWVTYGAGGRELR